MRNITTLVVAIIIVIVLLAYMLTYQVNYDQQAIITTFGSAQEPERNQATGEMESPDLITDAGFGFKAPWPIQKVHHYPRKIQLLEQQFSQFQTKDQFSVILRTYVTWRIEDPYRFFVSLRTLDEAGDRLSSEIQNQLGIVSKFEFNQFVNTDSTKLALDDIEDELTSAMQSEMAKLKFGISVEQVGIRRLVLPESTTERVFERMKSTRETLAAAAEQEGENRATAIRSDADRVKGQILAFAQVEAETIIAEGKGETVKQYDLFKESPELAIFLRKVDTLKQTLPGSTLILDAKDLEFLDLIRQDEKKGGN